MIAPVLLIMFNRPDTFSYVFEEVRKAKPEKLYIFQDGARPNRPDDLEKIIECRRIAENVDWECDVHRNYCEENNGCGKGPFKAINWLFDNEEEGIILEDDCIPSQSFFPFCTQMLARYKDDNRIFLITGCNFKLKTPDVGTDYFFGHCGTNCGWATWKYNWVKMDYACSWVKDKSTLRILKETIATVSKRAAKSETAQFVNTNRLVENNVEISHWDVQWQSLRYLNHQLSIIPSINLITNIGLGPTSTHAGTVAIPKHEYDSVGEIHFCYNKRFEFDGELSHPKHVMENRDYDLDVYNKLYPNFLVKLFTRVRVHIGKQLHY